MIVMDSPRYAVFRGTNITTAHCLSTLPGKEGTNELLTFGASIGMRATWLQYPGTYREHFDLMGWKCRAAIKAGAVEDGDLLAVTLREKRG